MARSIIMTQHDGHLYAAVTSTLSMSWTSLRNHALAQIEAGASDWHLATVGDSAENSLLQGLMSTAGAWDAIFGMIQTPGAAEPAGGWAWDNGETVLYTNWAGGEPNNAGLGPTLSEDFSNIHFNGYWNDIYGSYAQYCALVELDAARAVQITGTDGSDQLVGLGFGDVLRGRAGRDRLQGDTGNDSLHGGDGDDILQGGAGQDLLGGGLGADVFRFDKPADSRSDAADTIRGFDASIDRIDLARLDADSATTGDQAFQFIGTAAFSHHAAELRYQAAPDGSLLVLGDRDGDGSADFALVVKGAASLGAAAFLL